MTTCAVCEQELWPRWTDTHGVAVCGTCGLPYRLYHYENDVRVEKPPSIAIKEEWITLARKYWQETHRKVFPMEYDIGMLRSRGNRSYSGMTEEDCEAFHDWLNAHRDEWPVIAPPTEQDIV